jgi:hypothetical protein
MRTRLGSWLGLACLLSGAAGANAAPITLQGAAYILPSTSLSPCGATCLGYGTNILEIADGDTSNLNGWAGANGATGIIRLDLLGGSYEVDSFSLWNDLNVVHEGVGDFKLHFYDAADQLIGTSSVYTAPIGQVAAGVYSFASIPNVARVDLEVLTLLAGGSCCRIEIREVAFTAVPEPVAPLLAVLGIGALSALAVWRRAG